MPEYLSPGVYIEETSFRAKSIQGVATSTAGFVGPCRSGPIQGRPPLVTSFEEFRRTFGGLEDLILNSTPTTNYMAHAVKAFFDNGGQRLYIARVFEPADNTNHSAASAAFTKVGGAAFKSGANDLAPRFLARSPGRAGNLRVRVSGVRSGNLISGTGSNRTVQGVKPGDVVEVVFGVTNVPNPPTPKGRNVDASGASSDKLEVAKLYYVKFDELGRPTLVNAADQSPDFTKANTDADFVVSVQRVTLAIEVAPKTDRVDVYSGLSTYPGSPTFIAKVLRDDEPEDRSARVFFSIDGNPAMSLDPKDFGELLVSLIQTGGGTVELSNGKDGIAPLPATYKGSGVDTSVTGLVALGEVEDIAIVAAPGGCSAFGDDTAQQTVRDALITHCETLKYRFAVMSGKNGLDEGGIRNLRGQHDTTFAGLYFPWVTIADPFGRSGELLDLPPEGFVTGIYARTDIDRGVHKAPANETVRGALRFSRSINKGQQDTLNPEGINCLRSFEGRGHRVWGARTMSSDPEWTYVNVRRLFIYIEHSIDKNTQWVVFEPNNETLWLKVRLTIESFLLDVWRTGALMGTKADEAYFVRCDRSTMTQSDLDNGRLVVLVGVAPTKPAEFVIFRVGQWTADASII